MFLSKVTEAKECVKKDFTDITPVKKKGKSDIALINRFSNYLFDIFDANLMDEFHIMDKFEQDALDCFDNEDEEFTFEQQALHDQFMVLFESVMERFLIAEDVTSEDLFDRVKKCSEDSVGDAIDVIEVISCYTDFKQWGDHMKRQAANRRQYKGLLALLQAAVEAGGPNMTVTGIPADDNEDSDEDYDLTSSRK